MKSKAPTKIEISGEGIVRVSYPDGKWGEVRPDGGVTSGGHTDEPVFTGPLLGVTESGSLHH